MKKKMGSMGKQTMRFAAGAMAALVAGTAMTAVPYNVLADEVTMEWREENGNKYWYENGERQGVKYKEDGNLDDSYRGKEIYDPGSDAWYWLDNVQEGAIARSKDVYQESLAGQWGDNTNENGERTGKWVRYDGNGHMVKGWDTNGNGTYYFDPVYGTMAKGDAVIDGVSYHFNEVTGVAESGGARDDDGKLLLADGWHKVDGVNYWYENGVRQGVKYNEDGSIDTSYRGKEIYDPGSDAWYWLDCVQNGAVAKDKDVYQESGAGQWGESTNENGEKVGKWVRYDADGHMVKGWAEKDGARYYFDPVYGTMAKGTVSIDGKSYEFGSADGKLVREVVDDNNGNNNTEDNDNKDNNTGDKDNNKNDESTQAALSDCTVTLSQDSYESDGTEKKPEVTVKNGDEVIPSSEYTVTYSNNVNVGTATVTVSAKEGSKVISGSTTKTFTIAKKIAALADCTVILLQDSYESDGTEKKPEVTVKNGDEVIPSSEYTVTYSDNVNAGTAIVTITANNDSSMVSGSVTKTFTITEKAQEDNFEWSISDDGKLTVTGSCAGKLYTENEEDTGFGYTVTVVVYPWDEYKDQIKSAYINVTGLTDMRKMFYGCSNLSSVDLSDLDTSNVTDMGFMFGICRSLSSVDVSSFDTSNVTSMNGMFNGCTSLGSVDVSSFNTSSVTDMGMMFCVCNSLSSVDVSGFDTSSVMDMYYMFADCSSLSSVDVSGFDTSRVADMNGMFYGCSSLNSVDVSRFDTSSVTNMGSMFSGCSRLSSVDVSGFDTSSVTSMSGMFNICSSLSSVDVSGFNTSSVTSMRGMFSNCSSLSNVDVSGFDTSSVTDMSRMFYDCNSLSSIDVSGFDTSSVTDMSRMFCFCSSLNSVDLSGFDTSSVTDMSFMFEDCNGLNRLDLSSFDTSNVTNMRGMFCFFNSLSSVDLSSFDTSNVTDMNGMFYGCSSLTEILAGSGWDMSKADTGDMFSGCGTDHVTVR